MPSCWPPVAWPSLPCSTSCSDPARRIRKTTPDVRRSPCRWASFFVPPDCPGDAARVGLAAPLPRSRRTARGISAIRKKDEKARDSERLRKASPPSGWTGTAARDHGQDPERTRGAGRQHRPCQRLPGTGRIGRAHRTRGQSFPAGRGSVTGQAGGLPRPRRPGLGRGKSLSPVSCPAERDAWTTVRGCSAPPSPWTDHAAGEKKSRPDGRRTADKKRRPAAQGEEQPAKEGGCSDG